MTKNISVLTAFLLASAATGMGCELIASVDRSLINGAGGSTSSATGTGGGTSTATGMGGMGGATSTATGTGGKGGAGGGTATASASGTGGAGGAGGGSSSSASGTGGAGGGCASPTDCPMPPNECVTATCVNSVCGTSFVASGMATAAQTAKDCQKKQCDGAGNIASVADNADVPDDSNPCTSDVCTTGVPSNPPTASGVACGANGLCDGNGACVGCLQASDCPGTNDECKTKTCTTGVCGFSFTMSGFAVAGQTTGDCQKKQCDGAGNIASVADNSDVPVDGNQCTSDLCSNGVPSNPATNAGTTCSAGGTVCNGSGVCVACNQPTDCSGQDTACQTRTCASNTCGFSFQPNGTVIAAQTTGDCQQKQCNGTGTIVSVADNADVPVDGNQCTSDVCTAGVPSNPPTNAGTTCSVGGNTLCDGTGACVACNQASDCPATGNECVVATCTNHACGTQNLGTSHVLSTGQTAHDCQQIVCNGAGGTTSIDDVTDLPVSNTVCQINPACTGTPAAPSFTHAPTGTDCTSDGQAPNHVCADTNSIVAGSCVQCNIDADCTAINDAGTLTCNTTTHLCQ